MPAGSAEVAGLLCGAVNEEAPDRKCQIALDEIEALDRELQLIRDGDVIVVFYDKIGPVLTILNQYAVTVRAVE